MDLSYIYGVDNQSFFDSYWVIVHFVTGILVGYIIIYVNSYFNYKLTQRIYARFGITILILWEYFEVFLRYLNTRHLHLGAVLGTFLPHGFFEIESTTNIMSDLILGSLGLYVAVYYFWKYQDDDRQS